jgi:hypothetical protein
MEKRYIPPLCRSDFIRNYGKREACVNNSAREKFGRDKVSDPGEGM